MIPAFTRVASTAPVETTEMPHALPTPSDAPMWLGALTDRVRLYLLFTSIALLLVRPSDLVPALADTPLYETMVVVCLLVSLPGAMRLLTPGALVSNAPLMMCVLFVPALMISHLANANTYDARLGGNRPGGRSCDGSVPGLSQP